MFFCTRFTVVLLFLREYKLKKKIVRVLHSIASFDDGNVNFQRDCRRPLLGRQPVAVRLRPTVAGPMAAAVAPGSRSGAHPRHGRDAAGPVDGPAGHVRRPQERRRSRAGGRHLPGGPAVQGECAERQRHRQHGGQDVAPDRLSGPFAGGVLLGHRLVQRLLKTVNQRNIIIVYNFSNNNNIHCRLGERRSGVGDSVPLKENIRSPSLPRSILKKK